MRVEGPRANFKSIALATVSVAALIASTGTVAAGGFALREQSAEFQGMSFAGSAAGYSISSMFWNSAATASQEGLNTASSYSAILPDSKLTVTSVDVSGFSPSAAQPLVAGSFAGANRDSGDIGPTSVLSASYGTYQLTKDIFVGMAISAPFGLTTKPDNYNYQGSVIAQTTKLTTYNFNPTVAVRIAPWITVGVGAQIESADGTFRFATATPSNVPALGPVTGQTTSVDGNGWGFGATAGVMIDATPTTRIGIGYRSQMDQDIDGSIYTKGTPLSQPTNVTLKLPDVVTASIRQVVTPSLRLDGTFEWTNWSRFENLTVTAAETGGSVLGPHAAGSTIAVLPFNWSDGYFVSGGFEYDLERWLTGRLGAGYEWSPIDSPEKRSTGIPDANRVWLSGGLSFQFTKSTTVDLAYTHLFVEDAGFDRTSLSGIEVQGNVDSKIDIVSVGIRTRW